MRTLALGFTTLALTAAASTFAQSSDAGADDAYPLHVKVGEAATICDTGTIICPTGAAICDDPSIAVSISTERGVAFKGITPGTTLCGAAGTSGVGARRVYRVTVSK